MAASAFAQDRPPSPPEGQAQRQHGDHAGRQHDHQAARIQALHDALNIRADQEPAFHAYTTALETDRHGNKGPADGQAGAQPAAPTATPRAPGPHGGPHALNASSAWKSTVTAAKAFYRRALSPDQRRTFDALRLLRGGDHHRMGGHFGAGPRA